MEKPQPPLSGSLPLSDTQKPTLAPLRGEKDAEGKKRTRALTAERYFTAERKILDAQATSLPFQGFIFHSFIIVHLDSP
ncbi:hypothetical protein LR48_Vigan07g123300 [Vigna angularis]|uniref:Uncharacterized protein n=1 Tax=Phaseolus angularis TaxID=3914 RepID=A0A0L9UYB7_PHAAN|nr:hypothetical protein LR48_Vigan07g123300 [Vigna angularis]